MLNSSYCGSQQSANSFDCRHPKRNTDGTNNDISGTSYLINVHHCSPLVCVSVFHRSLLQVNDLPNFTKTSARKCYFYSSPARHDTVSPTDINTQRKRSSVEKKDCDEKENELHPQDILEKGPKPDEEGKTILSLSHLRPRERMAHDKHIQSTRKQKYKDSNSPFLDNRIQAKARNGSSSPAVLTTTPSPRELKAYEKHIRSIRERLHRAGLTYSHPDAMHSTTGNYSPATRHVKRIGEVDSPMDRGRWSG